MDADEPLTLAEYAAWAKVSPRQVCRLVEQGRIVPAADMGTKNHHDYRFFRTMPAPRAGASRVSAVEAPAPRKRAPKVLPYKPQIVRY